MTREEHIKWCKERAIAEMNYTGKPTQRIVSMMSDLGKHPETNNEVLKSLCMMQLVGGKPLTRQEVINFINGFN